MEEKRFVLFLILSLAVMTSYMMIHAWLFPPPQRAPANRRTALSRRGHPVRPEPDKKQDLAPAAEAAAAVPFPKEPAESAPGWVPPAENRLVALGSLAADSPYRFLVIFDSRGATIRWLELNERTKSGRFRYRNLEEKSGYLANLALADTADGRACRINVVGDGTPAALAEPIGHPSGRGLRAGDEIQAIDGHPIRQLADQLRRKYGRPVSAVQAFRAQMNQKRPGDEVTLTVKRGGKSSLRFKARLTTWPLAVIRPEATGGVPHPQSLLLSLGLWRDEKWHEISSAMRQANWETKILKGGKGQAVEFRFRLDQKTMQQAGAVGPLTVVKRYRLAPTPAKQIRNRLYKSYHLVLEVEVQNDGDRVQEVSYQLDGPTGLPPEGWWYSYKVAPSWSGAGARDVVWSSEGRRGELVVGCPTIFRNAVKGTPSSFFEPPPSGDRASRTLRHVGGDTKYFAAILQPAPGEDPRRYSYLRGEARPVVKVKKENRRAAKKTDTTFRLLSESHPIQPHGTFRHRFRLFAGPKQPDLLKQYGLQDIYYYGWFGFVSRPLVGILHIFEKLPLVNYGLAIILLTALVRAGMAPVSRKAAKNAQMMQLLQPEMKKIAEKYKNDMEKRGRAQQELFRKHNYNPFGGCLVMFLQLPIFLGLYRGLAVDIALRDQPLIPGLSWCSDLTGPDQLWYWQPYLPAFLASETGWLGPYLNILPIITVILFLVQQKLFTPPATDDQQRMTQRMMSFMTIFIGVMFFKVPSGLCIYFIASSLWGIAERQLLPKPQVPDHLKPSGREPGRKSKAFSKPGANGAARRQQAKRKRKKAKGKR